MRIYFANKIFLNSKQLQLLRIYFANKTPISSTAVSEALMAELLIIGGLLITASGLSLLNIKDCKTLNLLPSLLIPILWFLIMSVR